MLDPPPQLEVCIIGLVIFVNMKRWLGDFRCFMFRSRGRRMIRSEEKSKLVAGGGYIVEGGKIAVTLQVDVVPCIVNHAR